MHPSASSPDGADGRGEMWLMEQDSDRQQVDRGWCLIAVNHFE